MLVSVAQDHPDADLFLRPAQQRLFCAVGGSVRDEAGNVSRASLHYLDCFGDGPRWVEWDIGHILHFHPFKLKLNNTARAGLHVTSEWRTETGEMRYGSNFKIREDGVFVLNPGNVLGVGEQLQDAIRCHAEAAVINRMLGHFGLAGGYRALLALGLPGGRLPFPGPRILTH